MSRCEVRKHRNSRPAAAICVRNALAGVDVVRSPARKTELRVFRPFLGGQKAIR